jgi:O-acetyl-ADP-ribose deacetylase (regulator of RNase III)
VNHALHELKKLVTDEKIQSLALPRLATGKGGLDWPHVEPLVRTQLGSLSIPVFVYTTYVKGMAAKEPLQSKAAQ